MPVENIEHLFHMPLSVKQEGKKQHEHSRCWGCSPSPAAGLSIVQYFIIVVIVTALQSLINCGVAAFKPT